MSKFGRLGLVVALLLPACGGSTSSSTAAGESPSPTTDASVAPDAGATPDASETDATEPDAAVDAPSDGFAWTPGPDSAPYSVGIGPIDLAPAEETTVCVTLNLHNASPVFVTRITATLAEGSHHIIAYRSTDAQESLTPKKCQPFSGILNGTVPIMISQKKVDELVFPPNVGLKLAANQMIRLEAHYINTTGAPLQGAGTIKLDASPVASVPSTFIESDLAFWGNTNIKIAPQSTYSTGQRFQAAIPGVTGFALTTHQHRLATRMAIWYSDTGTPVDPPLADTRNWSDPPLYKFDPPLQFPNGAGLYYQCDWNNTTTSEVTFGESALQEMCFLWMYYYPSHGFDVCFDGLCPGRFANP